MELIEQNLLRKENCHAISAGQVLYYQERNAAETFSPFSTSCCKVKVEDVRDRGDHIQVKLTSVNETAIAPANTTWNLYHYYSNPEPLALLLHEPPAY